MDDLDVPATSIPLIICRNERYQPTLDEYIFLHYAPTMSVGCVARQPTLELHYYQHQPLELTHPFLVCRGGLGANLWAGILALVIDCKILNSVTITVIEAVFQ